jgi:hypothetical protein
MAPSTSHLSVFNEFDEEGMNVDKAAPSISDARAAVSVLYQNPQVAHYHESPFASRIYKENGLEKVDSGRPRIKRAERDLDSDAGVNLPHRHVGLFSKDCHATEMYFDPAQAIFGEQTHVKVNLLRWGSDSGFSNHRYQPPPRQLSGEERTKDLLDYLNCLEIQSSAANPRSSSPVYTPSDQNHTVWGSGKGGTRAQLSANCDDNSKSRKKRKSKNAIREEDVKFGPLKGLYDSHQDAFPQKSTSQSAIANPRRGSLTGEQKRTNHILSEQKRRNLLKQGFDDIYSLVPDLHEGGFSRSAVLAQAVEWLEDMLRGNELLKAQLSELKGQNMLRMT